MKRTIGTFIMGTAFIAMSAQDCNIALQPVVIPSADGNQFAQVDAYLANRARLLTAKAGEFSGLENSQFALTVGYDIVDKQIISGSPTKIIYNINLVMHIVDLKGKKVYCSFSEGLMGIGDNETKSLINTFQKINANNAEIKAFVQEGKQKIVKYYDENYTNIIKGAEAKAAMKNFDAAIYDLMIIPGCSQGYDAAMQELKVVYQQFVDQHCNENLAQARAAWIAAPNSEGAATASVYLSEIYPDAACYGDALELAKEIKKQMGEEWKFMMRRYEDSISLEQQRINAMRDISIAYANSQPRATINAFWK